MEYKTEKEALEAIQNGKLYVVEEYDPEGVRSWKIGFYSEASEACKEAASLASAEGENEYNVWSWNVEGGDYEIGQDAEEIFYNDDWRTFDGQ